MSLENEEKLAPCPDTPNCVVSMYPHDKRHHQEPWHYNKSREEVHSLLVSLLNYKSNIRLKEVEYDYIHATFRIPFFGFIDDVEFFLPPDEKVIHFRSASRKGRHDLGINASRMKSLRKQLEARA